MSISYRHDDSQSACSKLLAAFWLLVHACQPAVFPTPFEGVCSEGPGFIASASQVLAVHINIFMPTNQWPQTLQAYDDLEHFETPFVAKLHRFTPLAEPQAVFTFHHPNRSKDIDNSRYSQLVFEASAHPRVCHGFAGFFDAVLYKQVHLSILPATHTPNMASWFPIYFPVQQPVQLLANQQLELGIWRCGANHKVWYEWCITHPQCSGIHNPNGRSYFVGL